MPSGEGGNHPIYFGYRNELASGVSCNAHYTRYYYPNDGHDGSYEVAGAGSEEEWELGATHFLGEETSVDFRYYDGTEYENSYPGLSLAWDTTIFGG